MSFSDIWLYIKSDYYRYYGGDIQQLKKGGGKNYTENLEISAFPY